MCVCVCVCFFVYVYIYLHICLCEYIYIYTHTHVYISSLGCTANTDFFDSLNEFVLASRAVSHISCSSYFNGFRDGSQVAIQQLFRRGVASWFCSIQLVTFLCNSRVAFSPYDHSESMWCIHVIELAQLLLWRNCIYFIGEDRLPYDL